MKRRKLHIAVWKVVHAVIPLWIKHKFNFSYEKYDAPGPCLVLANHDTDWDPIMLGCAFPQQMYFVASEHIFRWGILSKLICFFLDPIARVKGTTAGDTALTILRRIKKGCSVAMFANGNRSFNGISEDILPSTGKLAKVSGVPLVTYRLEGGYFSQPRWGGKSTRRGKMTGRVMGVYSRDELKKMTVDEINAIINRDLYMDAYAVQRSEMVSFRGKRPAEHLEHVLCVCPSCGAIGSLKSHGKSFTCSCGYSVEYDEKGFFRGEGAVYDSVTDWDEFQTRALLDHAASVPKGSAIFRDEGFELRILDGHESRVLARGPIALYHDRLDFCGMVFPLEKLSGFALHGHSAVNFSSEGSNYELIASGIACTRKYQTVIRALNASSLSASI